jgi:hypothetical protein
MNKTWSWIFSIAIALVIIALLVYGKSNRQDYWLARRAVNPQVVIVQAPGDQVTLWRLHHWYER